MLKWVSSDRWTDGQPHNLMRLMGVSNNIGYCSIFSKETVYSWNWHLWYNSMTPMATTILFFCSCSQRILPCICIINLQNPVDQSSGSDKSEVGEGFDISLPKSTDSKHMVKNLIHHWYCRWFRSGKALGWCLSCWAYTQIASIKCKIAIFTYFFSLCVLPTLCGVTGTWVSHEWLDRTHACTQNECDGYLCVSWSKKQQCVWGSWMSSTS